MYGNVGYYTFAYCYSLERVTVISNEYGQIIAEGGFYDTLYKQYLKVDRHYSYLITELVNLQELLDENDI